MEIHFRLRLWYDEGVREDYGHDWVWRSVFHVSGRERHEGEDSSLAAWRSFPDAPVVQSVGLVPKRFCQVVRSGLVGIEGVRV